VIRSLLFSLLLFALASCSHEDLGPYLREADAVFSDLNRSTETLSTEFATLPSLGNPAFFANGDAAFRRRTDVLDGYAARWAAIKPPKSVKDFHQKVTAYIDDARKVYADLSEAAAAKSYEKVFTAFGPAVRLIDDENQINREWVTLGKKAKFDVSKAEARLKDASPDKAALRAYLGQVLPPLGRLADAFLDLGGAVNTAAGTDYFASVSSLGSRGTSAISEAKVDIQAMKPPPAAAGAHQALLSMVSGLQDLYQGLDTAARSRQFRALAEAYRPMSSILSSIQIGDCEWRNLVGQAELTTSAARTCVPLDARQAQEVDYVVGAFVVWGDITDSIVAAAPSLTGLGSLPPNQAFASLRSFSSGLRVSIARGLAAARTLTPPAGDAQFHASLLAYLNDLSSVVEEVSAAASANDSARYNAVLPRLNDMLGGRFQTLSRDFLAVWTPTFASLSQR
jgi:hypothetical protein